MLLRQLGWCAAELLSTPRQQRPEEGGRTGWLVFDADGLRSMSLDETTSFSDPPASPPCANHRRLGAAAAARLWRPRVAALLVCERQHPVGVGWPQQGQPLEGGRRWPVAADHAVESGAGRLASSSSSRLACDGRSLRQRAGPSVRPSCSCMLRGGLAPCPRSLFGFSRHLL